MSHVDFFESMGSSKFFRALVYLIFAGLLVTVGAHGFSESPSALDELYAIGIFCVAGCYILNAINLDFMSESSAATFRKILFYFSLIVGLVPLIVANAWQMKITMSTPLEELKNGAWAGEPYGRDNLLPFFALSMLGMYLNCGYWDESNLIYFVSGISCYIISNIVWLIFMIIGMAVAPDGMFYYVSPHVSGFFVTVGVLITMLIIRLKEGTLFWD